MKFEDSCDRVECVRRVNDWIVCAVPCTRWTATATDVIGVGPMLHVFSFVNCIGLMRTSHSHLLFIHHYYSLFPTVTMPDVMMIILLSLPLCFFLALFPTLSLRLLFRSIFLSTLFLIRFATLFSVTNLIILYFMFFFAISTSLSKRLEFIEHNRRTLVRWIENSYDSQWIFIRYESTNS